MVKLRDVEHTRLNLVTPRSTQRRPEYPGEKNPGLIPGIQNRLTPEELLGVAVLLMDVRGRVCGVDAEFAAAGMEDALDVHGINVRLDRHVLGGLVHASA
eukprot:1194109-Prorocentrum_minimum.AAC.1